MVQEWEVAATNLLMRITDSSNRPPTRIIKNHQGFDKYWTFDEHWRNGPGLVVQLGPEESETPATGLEDVKSQTCEAKVASTLS